MTLPPLRREVLVACDPVTAQRLWVEEIGTWWPIASFGCFGEHASVAFEGDEIVETSARGERAIWGTVTSREPGSLGFTWHPGRPAEQATQVAVTFTPAGDGSATLVTLVHTGWETEAARGEYAGGWVRVLDRFADAGDAEDAGDAALAPEPLWFVLEHTPGPATPDDGVFASPDFRRHVEFLQWLATDGGLVASGPLPDSPGSGMTIVRVPDAATARRVLTAAQIDDGAVRAGLLEVRARPWRVALSPLA